MNRITAVTKARIWPITPGLLTDCDFHCFVYAIFFFLLIHQVSSPISYSERFNRFCFVQGTSFGLLASVGFKKRGPVRYEILLEKLLAIMASLLAGYYV